jgi:hypothetical protein
VQLPLLPDENDIICWHYDHTQGCNVKGINFLSALYQPGGPAVFDIHGGPGALGAMNMTLESCQVLEGGSVWLRYRFLWNP